MSAGQSKALRPNKHTLAGSRPAACRPASLVSQAPSVFYFSTCLIFLRQNGQQTSICVYFHLCELYRTFPCLWKVKDDCYHNKRLKDDAYNKLLAYYQTTVPSATIDTVKRKINNLKSTFRKEIKKVKTQKSGSSADDNYVSNLWYFDLLMFTADQELPRNSISSESIEDIEQNETFFEDDNSPLSAHLSSPLHSPMPSHSQLPSHSPLPSHSSTQIRETTPSVSSTKSSANQRKRTLINEAYKALKEDDEYDGIGLNVACKLRRMNEDQRLYAESLINKVLLYGIKQKLQEETNFTGLVSIQLQIAHPVPSSQSPKAARISTLPRPTISNREQAIISSLSQSILQESSEELRTIPIDCQQPSQTAMILPDDYNESVANQLSQFIIFKPLE